MAGDRTPPSPCPQGKEVATNIVHLEAGTVVFEDIDPDDVKGQVLKALDDPADGNVSSAGQGGTGISAPGFCYFY